MADNILPEWRAVRESTTDADGFTWSAVTFEGFKGYSPSSGGDHVIYAGANKVSNDRNTQRRIAA